MPGDFLSPEGQQRRDQILQMALRDMRGRRRRRWISSVGGTAIIATLAVVISLQHGTPLPLIKPGAPMLAQKRTAPPISTPVPIPVSTPNAPAPPSLVEYITTDPTITDRLTLKPQPPKWKAVDDQEFLQDLADAGQPAGLAYVNGKAILLPR